MDSSASLSHGFRTRRSRRTHSDGPRPVNHGPEPCPVCGQTGAQEWLRAPDRLHGRQEKYTLVRCPAVRSCGSAIRPKPEEMHLHYTDAYHKLISAGGQNSPAALAGSAKQR